MKTTINNILTETLKGKTVTVYEYDTQFIYGNRRVTHWYTTDTDENRKLYDVPNYWTDLHVRKHTGIIQSISGYKNEYETLTMVTNVNNNDEYLNLTMEDIVEIVI